MSKYRLWEQGAHEPDIIEKQISSSSWEPMDAQDILEELQECEEIIAQLKAIVMQDMKTKP